MQRMGYSNATNDWLTTHFHEFFPRKLCNICIDFFNREKLRTKRVPERNSLFRPKFVFFFSCSKLVEKIRDIWDSYCLLDHRELAMARCTE